MADQDPAYAYVGADQPNAYGPGVNESAYGRKSRGPTPADNALAVAAMTRGMGEADADMAAKRMAKIKGSK